MNDNHIPYPLMQPKMNAAVAPSQVPPGMFPRLVGVDGRYNGCLHKFYGMEEVVDLNTVTGYGYIDYPGYAGVDFMYPVTFQKRGTSSVYHGFVLRWDKINDTDDQEVSLAWTLDNGSTWTRQAIWDTGNSITADMSIDCAVDGAFLYVAVEGMACKTVYYASSALAVVDSGPGAYAATLAALTDPDTKSQDGSYNLRGNGTFQVAYRFYDSTRAIRSAMSTPVTVTLDVMKTTKATGTITFNSGGGDSGLMVSGDYFTINSKKYEYITDNSADVVIAAAAGATVAQHVAALTDAINGYSSTGGVSAKAQASSVLVEATTRGSGGNAYTLAVDESAGNPDDISVSGATFAGGGEQTNDPEPHCKAVLNFPADDAVISGTSTFAGFDALFDKVDVFRTIDLGNSPAAQGAIFYLEQTLDMPANEGLWDAPLTVTIGTLLDDALPFQTVYDPEKDVVQAPPQSGAIGRYQGITFMGQAAGANQNDTLHSSLEHVSGEYFTTYNRRRGDAQEGRPMRYLEGGDSLMILEPNAIVHVFKSSDLQPIQYKVIHRNRGLVGNRAAHAVGNSIMMVAGTGLMVLSCTNGSMGEVSSANRILLGDWQSDLADIDSAYDSLMNASFFLNPNDNEILIVWHSTQTVSILEGANFVACGSTVDIATGKKTRAYFVTATGLVVMPDNEETENGNMWDLSSAFTLDGTTTGAASKTSIIDSGATFHADMIGALLYCTSGDNAGSSSPITAVDTGNKTLTVTAFTNNVATGDRYSIAPVPFSVRLWPLQDQPKISKFGRWVMAGISVKASGLSGFTSNDNAYWRVGAYRNSGTTLESGATATDEIAVSNNPADSAGAVGVDGIDVEPYIEQIACGVKFELTGAEVMVSATDSREITA